MHSALSATPALSQQGAQDYEVAVLPYRLRLVRLPKSNIAHSTHTLMRLLFFPNKQQQMFSFTEALDDVTLILDHETLATFPEGVLEVSNITWRALQVFAGAEGQAMNLVRSVSNPLADACISIMQVSTYESDFTLVPEYDLRKAVRCLSDTFTVTDVPEDLFAPEMDDVYDQIEEDCLSDVSDGQKTNRRKSSFSIALPSPQYNSDDEDEPDAIQEHPSSPASPTISPSTSTATLVNLPLSDDSLSDKVPSSKSSFSKRPDSHPPPNMHAHYPDELYITSIDEHSLPALSLRLIKLLFFSERQDRFLSFTRSTSNTISIIMDAETLSRFEPHTLHMAQGRWRLIRIGPEHEGVEGEDGFNCNCAQNGEGVWGMDQFGVFRDSVEPLIQEGISEIFYLSTFSNDWLMVPDQDFPKAQKALQAAYAPLSTFAEPLSSQFQTNPSCPSVFFSPKPKPKRRRSGMYRRRRIGSENSGSILHRTGVKGDTRNRKRSTSTCSVCSFGSTSSSNPSVSSSSSTSTLVASSVSSISSDDDTFLRKASNYMDHAIDEMANEFSVGVGFDETV